MKTSIIEAQEEEEKKLKINSRTNKLNFHIGKHSKHCKDEKN